MVGYLSKKPKLFVDDPGKLYRQRGRATQAKGLETLDPKAKVEGPSNLQGNHHLQVQRRSTSTTGARDQDMHPRHR
jgi:hypothetical protein